MINGQVQGDSILTPEEQAALAYAAVLPGAQAKLAAEDFIGGLDLPGDAGALVLQAITERINEVDPQQHPEITSYFRSLSVVLGTASLAEVIEVHGVRAVENVPDESRPEPKAALPVEETTIAVTDQDVPVIDEGTEKTVPLPLPQQNFLLKIFGDRCEDVIRGLTVAQARLVASRLTELYTGLDIRRSSPEERAARIREMRKFLAGQTYSEIAETEGRSYGTIFQGLNNMTGSITKRTTLLQRTELLIAALEDEGTGAVVIENESVVSEPQEIKQQEPIGLNAAIELLAETLKITARKDFGVLKSIFDPAAVKPITGRQAEQLREYVLDLLDYIEKDPHLPQDLYLEEIEIQILETILGANDRPPLSVASTQGKLRRELKQERRRINEVIATALSKIHRARSLVMQSTS